MSSIRDFAIASVKVAPSPATTGNTLEVQTGEGALMPLTLPFYLTAFPPNKFPTRSNAEKIKVTANASNVLTFQRAQGETTAKSIGVDWILVNSIYADDIFNSSISYGVSLTGTINGINPTFTLPTPFTSIILYKDGQRLNQGVNNDYIVVDSSTIQFNALAIPIAGEVLIADIIVGSQVMINGSNSTTSDETPVGVKDGVNTSYSAIRAYVSGSLEVFLNGFKLKRGVHFNEVSAVAGTFTIVDAPASTDDIMINYHYVASVAGNADTLDGYHYFDLMPLGAGVEFWLPNLPSANWMFAEGQEISRVTYAALFAQMGTTHGAGNGTTTFNLPDKRGRATAGKAASGTFAGLGTKVGDENRTLVTDNLPKHKHAIFLATTHGDGEVTADEALNTVLTGGGKYRYRGSTGVGHSGNSFTGNIPDLNGNNNHVNTSFGIVQPTIVANYIIKVA